MKMALIAIGILAAGLVGGMASDLMRGDAAPVVAQESPDRLEARVEMLEAAVDRLVHEVRLLADARVLPVEAPRAVPGEAAAAEALETDPASEEEIAAKVLETIEKREEKAREEREARMAAFATEREDAAIKKLESELGLTAYQSDELKAIYQERRKAMAALRDKLRAGREGPPSREDMAAMRDEMRQIQDDADQKLKDLLTDDQYKAVKKASANRSNRGGRGQRGGRR